MIKERPILFSDPMVRSILEGRKTQTRRIAKEFTEDHAAILKRFPRQHGCKYGEPGDRLWVREAWSQHPRFADLAYRADGSEFEDSDGFLWEPKWKPSIHMPRKFSRILLEITDIRVERLQDISEEDAKAEGMLFTDYGLQCFHDLGDGKPPRKYDPSVCSVEVGHQQYPGWSWKPTQSHEECLTSAKWAFANLWLAINGPDNWDDNPWVWAISFRRIEDSQDRRTA